MINLNHTTKSDIEKQFQMEWFIRIHGPYIREEYGKTKSDSTKALLNYIDDCLNVESKD